MPCLSVLGRANNEDNMEIRDLESKEVAKGFWDGWCEKVIFVFDVDGKREG